MPGGRTEKGEEGCVIVLGQFFIDRIYTHIDFDCTLLIVILKCTLNTLISSMYKVSLDFPDSIIYSI